MPQPPSEPSPKVPVAIEKTNSTEPLPRVNGSNASTRIQYVSTPVSSDMEKPPNEKQTPQKTIDLLFEMKQHKTVEEKEAKKIQQQYGRKRSQHRKRALSYFSIATFVDRAFGLDTDGVEKQGTTNGHHSSSSSASTPQVKDIFELEMSNMQDMF